LTKQQQLVLARKIYKGVVRPDRA